MEQRVFLEKNRVQKTVQRRYSDGTAKISEKNDPIGMKGRVLLGKVRGIVDDVDWFSDGTAKISHENCLFRVKGRVFPGKVR